MKIGAILLSTVLCVAGFTGFLFICSSASNQEIKVWSEPKLLYPYPDAPDSREFQAEVHEGLTHIVGGFRHLKDDRYLDDSKIFFLQQEENDMVNVQWLPTVEYPSEHPTLLIDHSGVSHFLWGDRRQDPDFEEWAGERPQIQGFSSTVVYAQYSGTRLKPPETIYNGHSRTLMGGTGDIVFPIQPIEDKSGRLHIVFGADSTFTATTPDGEEVVTGVLGVMYMTRSSAGEWSASNFLQPGVSPDIAILNNEHLVVAFLGSAPNQPGLHDVLVITSDNGGISWSDPHPVFFSEQQPSHMLRLKSDKNGRIHLIWGRQTRGLPIPNELWHSFSDDGGNTWSSPNRFFKPEQSNESEKLIAEFDFVIDPFGQIHWAGVVRELNGNGFLYYTTWNPQSKSWDSAVRLDFVEDPRRSVDLSLDETSGKLYLFWDEFSEHAIYRSFKNIDQPISPPAIASSGSLQLHANYPNPFNPITRISFTLEEPAHVVLTIYDISGRQIIQQDLGQKPAGLHSEEVNLVGFTSGTYIYEVEVNDIWRQQSTMMFIK